MRTTLTLISVSIALLAGTLANAQTAPAMQERVIVPSPVRVAAQSPYRMTADELREFLGQYAMEDGTTLSVYRKNRRLFAAVAGRPEVELVAVSATAFVARDGAAQVTFSQAANGNVTGVTLRHSGEDAS